MSKKIQTSVSEKNFNEIIRIIESKEAESFDGSVGNNMASTAAYLIDLGIKTHHLSRKENDEFDIENYRREVLLSALQSVQMNKALINILNALPEFNGRALLNEFFNNNDESKNWVMSKLNKFFKRKSD